jgi:hypothetical protein
MPQPHPGQEWRHNWIPVTATAMKAKNHGRKPGKNSRIAQAAAEAGAVLKRLNEKKQDRAPKPETPPKPVPSKPKTPTSRKTAGRTATPAPPKTSIKPAPKKTSTAASQTPRNRPSTSKQADDAIRRAAARTTPPARSSETGINDTSLAADATIPQIQTAVRNAHKQLVNDNNNGWVSITSIRRKLGEKVPRDRVDEALRTLNRMPDVAIAPASNQKTLTDADRKAAVHFGGQDKHLIWIAD